MMTIGFLMGIALLMSLSTGCIRIRGGNHTMNVPSHAADAQSQRA